MIRSIPLVLSGFALALAVYAALRSPSNESRAGTCEGWVSRADHERLRAEVQLLARALARQSAARGEVTAPTTPSRDDDPVPERHAEITRVEAPAGIRVNVDADGAVRVENRNPSLVGQTIIVQGHREDGTVQPMSILVPPVTP
jgi:hypothetical protein